MSWLKLKRLSPDKLHLDIESQKETFDTSMKDLDMVGLSPGSLNIKKEERNSAVFILKKDSKTPIVR